MPLLLYISVLNFSIQVNICHELFIYLFIWIPQKREGQKFVIHGIREPTTLVATKAKAILVARRQCGSELLAIQKKRTNGWNSLGEMLIFRRRKSHGWRRERADIDWEKKPLTKLYRVSNESMTAIIDIIAAAIAWVLYRSDRYPERGVTGSIKIGFIIFWPLAWQSMYGIS